MKRKIVKYGSITVITLIACLVGYLFVNSSFAQAGNAASAPYVTGEAATVENSTITTQTSDAKPLTSTNKALPKIPTTIGTKGTETNPFVVLEIVPDHSEQALSYLVPSQEEGLPYDPIELGIQICDNNNTNMVAQYNNGSTNFNNLLSANIGGVFNNNNHYTIYSGNGEDEKTVDYSYIKKYYEVDATTDMITDDDFNNLTVEQLDAKYPDLFVTDKDGVTIRDVAIKSNRDWKKTKEKTKEYSYTVEDYEKIQKDDYDNLTVEELATKYPKLFDKDKNGTAIESTTLKDEANWKKTSEEKTIQHQEESIKPSSGYFYNAGLQKGDYSLDNVYYATFKKSDTASNNQWVYYENKSDLPADAYRLLDKIQKWDVGNHFTDGTLAGGYLTVDDLEGWNKIITQSYYEEKVPVYTYSYKKTEYNYNFKFYGLAVNDILKRRLFYRATDKEYENFHIQVITLTPSEINEMDQNDTPDTLNYIERADMYYVAMFDSGDDNIKSHINFYRKYIAKEANVSKDSDVTFYDYIGNDLEWVDCMKVMNRLANNKNLPLMFENVVGDMLNSGVNGDGTTSCHIYLNANRTDEEQVGSLNNIAKLYLTTVQLDLTKTTSGTDRTFLNDIYPKFKQIKLTHQTGDDANTAKYTGYYERINSELCTCNQSEEYKKRCFYLWGKAMFYPNAVITDNAQLINEYGYLANFINGGDPSSFNNNRYNGGMHKADSTRGDDEKNVAIVYDGSANTNKTIFDNGGFNNMGTIMESILANGGQEPTDIVVKARKNKRQYERMSDDSIMLDYSADAKYKTDKTIMLRCNLQNSNNEDSIIQSITFVNDETGQKKTMTPQDISKESVTYSNGGEPMTGYRIPKNSDINIVLPFSRADWQSGYTTVSITTVARISYRQAKKTRYKTGEKKESNIVIMGRTLFNLE